MAQFLVGVLLVVVALALQFVSRSAQSEGGRAFGVVLRIAGLVALLAGAGIVAFATAVVIAPGEVGVRHAFGYVDRKPLLPGLRFVLPWSEIEHFSMREEPFPEGEQPEHIAALSSEQMGMTLDIALRWQIDPQQAPRIFTEIGDERQIHSAVRNAIRKGVRDGMVQFSINDIAQRARIATTMEGLVNAALVTQPRAGGGTFRIATVTAFFLRDLQPPQQVVQAINDKIAQEQQIETERHRVEVARLQAEQQRLFNQTLTPEALTKLYLDVLHDMRNSSNLVILVPTAGGLPVLNIGELRQNLRQPAPVPPPPAAPAQP